MEKFEDSFLNNYKTIFWDFDGVLMNSNEIRDLGFVRVLSSFPEEKVDKLIEFHKKNGGLSRYVKFRYFFEEILNEEISDEEVNNWAKKFSKIMLDLLIDDSLLIKETIDFVKKEFNNKEMHIVSGSDQNELRLICCELNLSKYFISINGSPEPKISLVRKILGGYEYKKRECVLIGDSVNDKEAAKMNGIDFIPYNYN